MARIPLPSPETMTADQLKVYEEIIAGPRRTLVGPLRAALHRPELAARWQKLGALLRYETSLSPRLTELAVLVTARRWNSQVEWHIHEESARKAGLCSDVIDAIREGLPPTFSDAAEAEVYDFACALQHRGAVSDVVYQRVLSRLDAVGVVELTAIIGYYTMVAMTLNAHEIPMPPGCEPNLDVANSPDGPRLVTLPAAHLMTHEDKER